jgi:hypothetical protein
MKLKTQAIMHELLVPNEDDTFNTIQILVSEEIAKDFKNLDFGFNSDTSYLSYHCSISPFMVILVSMAQASQQRQAADRYAHVGRNLTLNDMNGAETTPDATPQSYRDLMDMLKCYCFALQRMLGARCNHFWEESHRSWDKKGGSLKMSLPTRLPQCSGMCSWMPNNFSP